MSWTVALAIVLRPFAYAVLFGLVIAPVMWMLWKVIPEGRLKTMLFKVRSGHYASRRDKIVMVASVVGAYMLLALVIGLFIARGS